MGVSSSFEVAKGLLRQGKEREAENYLIEALRAVPDDFEALQTLVALKTNWGQWDEAIVIIEDRIAQLPPDALRCHLLADIMRAVGRMDESELYYRRAITEDPSDSASYAGLAQLKKYDRDNDLLPQIEQRIAAGVPETKMGAGFYFAAAKICDDIGDYAKAFDYYQKANVFSQREFSVSTFLNGVAALKEVFSKDFVLKRKDFGCSSHEPVFIVGMPRSGTTLVEQMIAVHAQVAGVGERADIPGIAEILGQICGNTAPYPYSATGLNAAQASALGGKYVEKVRRHINDPAVVRIVDKNPLNFLHLGLIGILLPRAKIIHMRRNPLDTCLSCYFQNFADGLEFTFSLESLAGFYEGYRELMDHWRSVFPERIIDVDYEQVAVEPKRQVSRMLEFCGIEGGADCLEHVTSRQPIRTASVVQVRQPLYKTSIARWKKYEGHIQELTTALEEYI